MRAGTQAKRTTSRQSGTEDCTYRAHAGVRGSKIALDATLNTRPPHGFQQPVNMHNTQHTDNRGFQIGCNADSSARRSSRGKADSSARRSCCPARRAVLRGHQRNVHQRHPHNTAVQCEWCTAWHALLCSFSAGSHHGGGQVRHTVGTRGPSASTRHVELLASCQCSQRAMSLHGSGPNCACVTGAFRASAARRQADSSARRCTARGPSGRRGFCVSPPGGTGGW